MSLQNQEPPGAGTQGGSSTVISEAQYSDLHRRAQELATNCGLALDGIVPRRTALAEAIKVAAVLLAVLEGHDANAIEQMGTRSLRGWVALHTGGGAR